MSKSRFMHDVHFKVNFFKMTDVELNRKVWGTDDTVSVAGLQSHNGIGQLSDDIPKGDNVTSPAGHKVTPRKQEITGEACGLRIKQAREP